MCDSNGEEHAKMRKIVIAHPHFMYPGGASTAILETMQQLVAHDYEIHIISIQQPSDLAERFPTLRFHTLGGALSSELRYWLSLPLLQNRFNAIVLQIQPDIVVASVFPANYWAFLYRIKNPQIPCVWYCQEPSAFIHDKQVISGVPWPMRGLVILANPVLQVLDRRFVRAADAIIVNSKYSAGRVQRVYKRLATPVHLGVNSAQFTPSSKKDPLILTVARLTKFKRVDIFIKAASILKQRGYSNVRWVIAGDGEEGSTLKQIAHELGVQSQVEFTGRLSASVLIDYYNRAAIVVVTAIGEPFGLVPIEAMAAEAAVVCSDSGGPAETVTDGITGYHFRSGDVSSCAEQIEKLLDNLSQARAFGQRGRQMTLNTYTWKQTAIEVDAVLSELLTKRST